MTTKLYYQEYADGAVYLNGYTLYLPYNVPCKYTLPDYCISSVIANKLADSEKICNTDIGVLPKGSSVHVLPNCRYAAEDIRKHYTIKRDADTGDYNVYSPLNLEKCYWVKFIRVETILYWPARKIAIGTNTKNMDTKQLAQDIIKFVPTMSPDEAKDFKILFKDTYTTLYFPHDYKNVYAKVLDGVFKKPLVSSEQLDITNENQLSLDVLMLIYHTVDNTGKYSDKSNIVTQLNMLNQYNWRNYPGTMSVFKAILSIQPAFNKMQRQSSRYNKVINEFLTYRESSFWKQEDLELAQAFLYNLLGFDKVMFVRASDLDSKLRKYAIPPHIFEKVFDTIVKISPKRIG